MKLVGRIHSLGAHYFYNAVGKIRYVAKFNCTRGNVDIIVKHNLSRCDRIYNRGTVSELAKETHAR